LTVPILSDFYSLSTDSATKTAPIENNDLTEERD